MFFNRSCCICVWLSRKFFSWLGTRALLNPWGKLRSYFTLLPGFIKGEWGSNAHCVTWVWACSSVMMARASAGMLVWGQSVNNRPSQTHAQSLPASHSSCLPLLCAHKWVTIRTTMACGYRGDRGRSSSQESGDLTWPVCSVWAEACR